MNISCLNERKYLAYLLNIDARVAVLVEVEEKVFNIFNLGFYTCFMYQNQGFE